MLLAPALGAPPREIAERLGAKLSERLGDARRPRRGRRARASSTSSWPTPGTSARRAAGRWPPATTGAAARPSSREKVNVEYVSANPTGPLTAASGRHAAYGDALARLLELAGHEVSREYYFNNAGSQVDKLGASVRAARPQRAGARGRLPGRLRGRARAADPGRRRDATPSDARRARRRR